MTRRNVLTAVELAAVTTALGASLPILAHAANYGCDWAGPALFGTLVAGMILAPVAATLLLIAAWKWASRSRADNTPPSARFPLWPTPDSAEIQAWDREHPQPHQDAYEAARRARYEATSTGTAGRHSAPAHDGQTQTMPVVDLAAFDYEYSGGSR